MKTDYIVFDTETTGFAPAYRMTQLAFIRFSEDGTILEEYQAFTKPDRWTIPKEKFFLDNGMTTERNEKLGVPVFEVLMVFQEALKKSKVKIAHNLQFDKGMVIKELDLAGIEKAPFLYTKEVCTMLSSVQYVGALNKWGKPGKWPNLAELYKKCFNEDFTDGHDALADVKATVRCFLELKKRGIIK